MKNFKIIKVTFYGVVAQCGVLAYSVWGHRFACQDSNEEYHIDNKLKNILSYRKEWI